VSVSTELATNYPAFVTCDKCQQVFLGNGRVRSVKEHESSCDSIRRPGIVFQDRLTLYRHLESCGVGPLKEKCYFCPSDGSPGQQQVSLLNHLLN
jgi:hypothetical protein